jgi:hypothetical protein
MTSRPAIAVTPISARAPRQDLGLLHGGRDRGVLLERGEAGDRERGPEHVGAVDRVAQQEAGVAQHRQRGVGRGQVHPEVLGQLADAEAPQRVGGEEGEDVGRPGGGGRGAGHAGNLSRLDP